MNCIKTGALISVPAYNLCAPADIYQVGQTTLVVRFNGDPQQSEYAFTQEAIADATHVLEANGLENFIRFDLGIIVIDRIDLRTIESLQESDDVD